MPFEEKFLCTQESTETVIHEVQICYGGTWLCRDLFRPLCIWKVFGDDDFIILLLYVDDMLILGRNMDIIKDLKEQLKGPAE